MTPDLIFAAVIVTAFIVFVFLGRKEQRKRNASAIRHFREIYGTNFGKNLSSERLSSLDGFFKHKNIPESEKVDEITSSDLSLTDLFHRIDQTQSAAGEEYLYYLLHCFSPVNGISDEEISYFESEDNKSDREKIQLALHKLGNTGRYSFFDYMDALESLPGRSNVKHYAGLLFILVSVLLMFISARAGVILFVIAVTVNIALYYREKAETEPYLVCFRYLLRLLQCGSELIPLLNNENLSEASDHARNLELCMKPFTGFRRFAGILISDGGYGSFADVVIDYLRILFHLDLIAFNNMLGTIRSNSEAILMLAEIVGRADCAVCIASFRKSLPYYTKPVICGGAPNIEDLYHPLLSQPVSNSIELGKPVLLTGSNASGKSTFIKAVSICSLLAQTIVTCPARRYEAPVMKIMTSMALKDSLKDGDSYFMAEIKSLKRIADAAQTSELPVLCCIDEVLRGTNTIERIAASAELLKWFAGMNIFCIAATHDTELADLLEEYADFHFSEEIQGEDVCFTYRLKPGKADTRNALRLLAEIGFNSDLIDKAQTRAAYFESYGKWK